MCARSDSLAHSRHSVSLLKRLKARLQFADLKVKVISSSYRAVRASLEQSIVSLCEVTFESEYRTFDVIGNTSRPSLKV